MEDAIKNTIETTLGRTRLGNYLDLDYYSSELREALYDRLEKVYSIEIDRSSPPETVGGLVRYVNDKYMENQRYINGEVDLMPQTD